MDMLEAMFTSDNRRPKELPLAIYAYDRDTLANLVSFSFLKYIILCPYPVSISKTFDWQEAFNESSNNQNNYHFISIVLFVHSLR